jgi:hypothetical protein
MGTPSTLESVAAGSSTPRAIVVFVALGALVLGRGVARAISSSTQRRSASVGRMSRAIEPPMDHVPMVEPSGAVRRSTT